MTRDSASGRIMPSTNVREFFRDSVDEALSRQKVRADDDTVHYVVNLLTLFARAEELYEDQAGLRPLAAMLGEAAEAPTAAHRERAMQRLGDVALFVAGFFPDYFARRCVDVDYYIRMGGSAYSWLAERARQSAQVRVPGQVFAELSEKFGQFVDVIGEVSEQGRSYTPADIMRLYELWLATGSARASRRLRELGVQPTEAASSRATH